MPKRKPLSFESKNESPPKQKLSKLIQIPKTTPLNKTHNNIVQGKHCPYMDTIERKSLDFDFDKVCSVSLAKQNVYACLVCGHFFNGRSKNTHAYFHSINSNHHLFIHIENKKVYCLPDGYQVEDPCLDDIRNILSPDYSAEETEDILFRENYGVTLDGATYIPGRIGINNLGNTDYINSVLQCLFSVHPFAKYFLNGEEKKVLAEKQSEKKFLIQSFGELIRKFFNPKNFKGQISPQEFLQTMDEVSGGKYKISSPKNPVDFFVWLLNNLHKELKNKRGHSIVSDVFRGRLECEDLPTQSSEKGATKSSFKIIPFFYLSLDLPPTPLYRGEEVEKFIPQVPITDILGKFGGEIRESDGARKRYSVHKFPRFLVLHIKRYIKNDFRPERNPTIVNFPIKNLELKIMAGKIGIKRLNAMSKEELVRNVKQRGLWGLVKRKLLASKKSLAACGKANLINLVLNAEASLSKKYNLVGNIVHEGQTRDSGTNRAFVLHKANGKWYEAQDLSIEETMAQLVSVSESYVQIWELVDEGED